MRAIKAELRIAITEQLIVSPELQVTVVRSGQIRSDQISPEIQVMGVVAVVRSQ